MSILFSTAYRVYEYGTEIPGALLNGIDQLGKTIKLADNILSCVEHFGDATPVTIAAKSLIKSAKWLPAVLVMRDFKFWTDVKNGEPAFLVLARRDVWALGSISCFHLAHALETFKLAKDLGVEALGRLDSSLGKVSFLGDQLGMRLLKDSSVLLGATFGFVSIVYGIASDNRLFERLGQGRIFEILTEERLVGIVGNISKIYIMVSVLFVTPVNTTLCLVGLASAVTDSWKLAMKHESQKVAEADQYRRKKAVMDRLPKINERLIFGTAASAA